MKANHSVSPVHLLLYAGLVASISAVIAIPFANPATLYGWYDRCLLIGWIGMSIVGLSLVGLLMGMHKRPLRFTLRSLFIVTTFLAVVLGMIAWLDRSWIGK
jgi:hypothetical protein